MAKANSGTQITDAPLVIALGPGFTADHEPLSHNCGDPPRPHPGPRPVEGSGAARHWHARPNRRLHSHSGAHAPTDGYVVPLRAVRQTHQSPAKSWQASARSRPANRESRYERSSPGCTTPPSFTHPCSCRPAAKLATWITGNVSYCFTISEKSLAVAGGVLEAILSSASLTGSLTINGNTHL